MKILLTGFEPFGGEPVNPALEAVKLVKAPEGIELVKLEIPCVFDLCTEKVLEAIEAEQPDAVLCIGQAEGRDKLTPERVAINIKDARIADNKGNQPVDEPCSAEGHDAYFATLPIKGMVKAMQEAGVPAAVSNTAGTFCCNNVMYGVLHYLHRKCSDISAGFMHVPCIPEQLERMKPGTPALPLETIVKGIEASLTAIAEE